MPDVVGLDVCLQNLTVVSKVAVGGRLRLLRLKPESTPRSNIPLEAITPATHRLVLEDRWLLQGVQRAATGDGHGPMIGFLREVLDSVQRHANASIARDSEGEEGGGLGDVPSLPSSSLFCRRPRELLHRTAIALTTAHAGLDILRTSTYVDMEQVRVDLQQLMDEIKHVFMRIEGYLHGTFLHPITTPPSFVPLEAEQPGDNVRVPLFHL
jgi:hypothetical protein